jgi:type II secretory pathway pseudopilin PulG
MAMGVKSMKNKKLINYKQLGDTIVEVLIAIAILGFAIGSAFAIANKSKLTLQANQERYQAQLLANAQADEIKQFTSDPSSLRGINSMAIGNVFCMYYVSTPPSPGVYLQTIGAGPIPSVCKDGMYSIRVTKEATGIGQNSFYIEVTWDSLVNSNGNRVSLLYGI